MYGQVATCPYAILFYDYFFKKYDPKINYNDPKSRIENYTYGQLGTCSPCIPE